MAHSGPPYDERLQIHRIEGIEGDTNESPASDHLASANVVAPSSLTPLKTPYRPSSQVSTAHTSAAPTSAAPTSSGQTSSALGQAVFFLLAMGTMLTAARYAMPTIVEEVRYAWHRGELRAQYEESGNGLKNVSLSALSDAYQMVTDRVGPSVVHIDVERAADARTVDVAHFLSGNGFDATIPLADQGSGVIVDEAGFIVTNRHVIAGGDLIMVGLSDGRRVPAQVVGTDALTDLAVLKVNTSKLLPIEWGDSDRCKVGAPVWAVGSPFGLDRTVTFGILSGKHRMVKASTRYQDFMQSDVAVNPGNSGGPLVDANGRLVGINTAIVGDTYRGVSFSIPSNIAHDVYDRLRASGRYDRGWLGVALEDVPDELLISDNHRQRGAMISALVDGKSPAAAAGLLAGDIIQTLNDEPINDMGHLMRMIGCIPVGTKIALDVRRSKQPMKVHVIVGAKPPMNDD